jgi:hypothetical protein
MAINPLTFRHTVDGNPLPVSPHPRLVRPAQQPGSAQHW